MKVTCLVAYALTILCASTASAQGRGGGAPGPAPPAPRWPDGTINLGAVPGTTGLWDGAEPLATNPKNYETVAGRPRPGRVDLKEVPLQPWAQALLDERHARFLADEPYTRCKPSPAARSFGTAYGIELLNIPGSDRIYLFQTGGAHSFRVIYLDGRTHPARRRAERLRALDRMVGGRHARHRHHRHRRERLARTVGAAAHRQASHHREGHAAELQYAGVRADSG